MKAWNDSSSPDFPRLGICRDEPFSHYRGENLCENALIVCLCIVSKDMLDNGGVRYDYERLWTEKELVKASVLFVVVLQTEEKRPFE